MVVEIHDLGIPRRRFCSKKHSSNHFKFDQQNPSKINKNPSKSTKNGEHPQIFVLEFSNRIENVDGERFTLQDSTDSAPLNGKALRTVQ